MSFCPNCLKEYEEGITHCPDCKEELVDSISLKDELLKNMKPYEFKEDTTMQSMVEELDGSDKKPASAKLYKSPEERYADARSSAFAFLFVGCFGILAMILAFAGVFTLPFHNFALVTMTVLFAVFAVIGMVSLKNSKKIHASIGKEHARIQEIRDWYQADGIHSDVLAALEEHFTDEADEDRYLQRYEMVRTLLKGQFPEESDVLLDKLASDFCEE